MDTHEYCLGVVDVVQQGQYAEYPTVERQIVIYLKKPSKKMNGQLATA